MATDFRRIAAAVLGFALMGSLTAPWFCVEAPSPSANAGHCSPIDGLTVDASCCCGSEATEIGVLATVEASVPTDVLDAPPAEDAGAPALDYIQDTSPRLVSYSSSIAHRFTVLRI